MNKTCYLGLLPLLGTNRAKPFALGLAGQTNTPEMEPLDSAVLVIARDHLTIRDLLASTIGRFVRVHRHV